jgi:HAD superfamily hydrolase (TIGR01509 family)
MLRGLIWDVDGTLAETEEAHRTAFNLAFAEAGLGWHWDQQTYARLLAVSGGKERIAHFQRSSALGVVFHAEGIAALHDRKTLLYAELISSGRIALRPGVRRLLDEAEQAGLQLGIATTTSAANVRALLDSTMRTRIPHWQAMICGDDVPRKKPAPDVYVAALAQLGLSGGECLAIEDSENGLHAALAAGIACVVTPSAYTDGQDFREALAVLDHLGDADQPCRIMSGPAQHEACMTVAGLRRLHARA